MAARAEGAEIVKLGVNPEWAVEGVMDLEAAGLVAAFAAAAREDDATAAEGAPVGGFEVFGVAGERLRHEATVARGESFSKKFLAMRERI